MSAAATKAIPLIVSRRALQRLSNKYPQHLKETINQSKPKKDDTAWPVSMQRAGYAAVAFAIPYSICVTIAESPRLRDRLEGDPGPDDHDPIGRKVVNFVRWYWGHEDMIPYSEYVETKDHKEISLDSDISTMDRLGQASIQHRVHDEVQIRVETDGDGEERFGTIPGSVPASDISQIWSSIGSSNGSKELEPKQVYVTFEDGNNNTSSDENESNDELQLSTGEGDFTSPAQDISRLTTIWSAWNHFANAAGGAENSQAATTYNSMDADEIHIEELQYAIQNLQKDLRDPYCSRDRDEMEQDIAKLKREVGASKRERRMGKLKKMVSFS